MTTVKGTLAAQVCASCASTAPSSKTAPPHKQLLKSQHGGCESTGAGSLPGAGCEASSLEAIGLQWGHSTGAGLSPLAASFP
jgi:hypothetical protein